MRNQSLILPKCRGDLGSPIMLILIKKKKKKKKFFFFDLKYKKNITNYSY